MSTLFDDPKPVDTQAVVTDPAVTIPTATEQLVGEGKKFKDVESLALGKVESDKFVTDLQAQLSEVKSKLGEQDYAKTLLEQLQNASTNANPVKPVVQEPVSTEPKDDTLFKASEEDLRNLVEKTFEDREVKSKADNNLKIVREALEKEYGTEATAKLKAVATELGLTESYIDTIAAQSPAAIFQLIGKATKEFQPNVNTTVRTEGVNLSSTNQRNSKFYSDLYKSNRKSWSSLEVQNQMVADATKLGTDFYKP
jgi:hypothetical protein